MRKATCPYCGTISIPNGDDYQSSSIKFDFKEWPDLYLEGTQLAPSLIKTTVFKCQNDSCEKYTVRCFFMEPSGSEWTPMRSNPTYSTVHEWQLIPESKVKSFPDYIPQQIRTDYEEAYLIKDLSPKASATLSRRCLQSMIRDFWKISKGTLNQEINALDDKLDPSTLGAIHALREIGNIGAHMSEEKGTKEILDVTPGKAEALLGLIGILFKDWYIAKYEKEESFKKLMEIAESKKQGKTD